MLFRSPLARVMRQELKKRRIKHLKVVYSKETPMKPIQSIDTAEPTTTQRGTAVPTRAKQTPGSNAFVPSVVGLIIASEVVKDIIS